MDKTNKEWLQMLKSPIKEKAVHNTEKAGTSKSKLNNSISQALAAAFLWQNTIEGAKYWTDVHNKLLREER